MMLFALEQGMAALHRGGWSFDVLMPCYETFLKVVDG